MKNIYLKVRRGYKVPGTMKCNKKCMIIVHAKKQTFMFSSAKLYNRLPNTIKKLDKYGN